MDRNTHRGWLILPFVTLMLLFGLVVACSDDDGDGDSGDSGQTNGGGSNVTAPELPGPEQPDGGSEGSRRPSCAATEAISWNAAVDHVGNEVSVLGPVYAVDQSESDFELVIGSDEVEPAMRLDVVLTDNALNDFAAMPADLFQDEEVCVIGVIQAVDGNLQIVINESADIVRL